jgi:uncharacterized protein (DUF1330 family)
MPHENLIGLHVTDDASYARYREHMTPILTGYGGGFRYDFQIAETLQSATPAAINRVFVICFPDAAAKRAFFADPAYLAVRARYFTPAVAAVTVLTEYDTLT